MYEHNGVLCAARARAQHADSIIEFVRKISVQVDGVGCVCGYSLFDLGRFGNPAYGAPADTARDLRSRQGKLEKSLVNFQVRAGGERSAAARWLLRASREH